MNNAEHDAIVANWERWFFSMLAEHDERQRWRERAACRGRTDVSWFPASPDAAAPALAICARCPVIAECAIEADERPEEHGIWAGLTEQQRRRRRSNA